MAFSTELILILLFSILGGLLAVRFRQPSVLGLIIAGAVVGPYSLGLIKNMSLIDSAIEIGAILLLFTVGIEFSLPHLLRFGLKAVIIGAFKLGVVFLASYYTSLLFGLGTITAVYIGVILSITSTVIVIKIAEQKDMAKREELPLLIAILIIEDIFGVFALTFFSSLNSKADVSPLNIFTQLAISIVIMAAVYLMIQRLLKPAIGWLVKYSTEDTITFTSLGLCGGMSYIASLLNLSPSVGAFLAGNIVSSLPESKMFEKAIHPFILTFTSLFFFSIGTIVDFSAVWASIYLVIALFIVNIASKYIAIGFGSYLLTNFNGKQAAFSGIAMLSVGEFSLLIAKEGSVLGLGVDLVSITAAIILLSSITMSMLISHDRKIYKITTLLLPGRARADITLASKFINSLSWGIARSKTSMGKMLAEWRQIVNNMVFLIFLLAIGLFVFRHFRGLLAAIIRINAIVYALAFVSIAVFAFPAFNIAKNASKIFRFLLTFLTQLYPKEIADEKKILKNFFVLASAFLILAALPIAFFAFSIHPAYNIIEAAFVAVVLVYFFRCSKLVCGITSKYSRAMRKFGKIHRNFRKKK